PVCHAGELISWESAWALGLPGEPGEAWDGEASSGDASAGDSGPAGEASAGNSGPASARPPIYFGPPPVPQTRRWNRRTRLLTAGPARPAGVAADCHRMGIVPGRSDRSGPACDLLWRGWTDIRFRSTSRA